MKICLIEGKYRFLLMLSLDEDPEKTRSFIEEKSLPLPVYFLNRPTNQRFNNSTVVPTNLYYFSRGNIVLEKKEAWRSTILRSF